MLKLPIHYLLIALIFSLATACAPGTASRRADMPASPNLVQEQNGDEEEYELIIIDPGFEQWFATRGRPVNYYEPSFYENWNQRYVSAWNERVSQAPYHDAATYPFQERIEYDPTKDYGVELNHKLFWYFRYIQSLFGRQYNFPGFSIRNF